jgi:transposase
MTQRDRDRLVALKKAKKGLITQREAAEEIGQSERHVRRLLKRLRRKGDSTLVHVLRGRRSNRKLDEKIKERALEILRGDVYRGFGPTLAAEYLDRKHDIHAGRETVRGWMIEGKLWRASRQRVEKIHVWRQRRSRLGEMIQWDTSEHAWLEDRGVKLYLISMIDDASSRLHARFVLHDSTEETCACCGATWSATAVPSATTPTKRVCFKPPRKLRVAPQTCPGTSALLCLPRKSDGHSGS